MNNGNSLSARARDLLFTTLEILRKEIRPQFSDWKDADDWLFSELDITKGELAQIYDGRNVLYYDGSAVDLSEPLAGRLVNFMKDYDFYHFMDSLEVGGEEEVVGETEKALASKEGLVSYVEALTEILDEGDLTSEQEANARALIEDLNALAKAFAPRFSDDPVVGNGSIVNDALLGITEITVEQANQIYNYMQEAEGGPTRLLSESGLPFINDTGKYYLRDGDKFVGIDYTSDYECYVEEFECFEECVAWLNYEAEIGDILSQRGQKAEEGSLEAKMQDAAALGSRSGVVSVAHFAENDAVKNAVLASDLLRNRTLDACYAIPGYRDLPLKERNQLYDLVKKAVLRSDEVVVKSEEERCR